MTRAPSRFLSRCKKDSSDKKSKASDETQTSSAPQPLRSQSKASNASATSAFSKLSWKRISRTTEKPLSLEDTTREYTFTTTKFLWKKIGLTTDKPIPLKDFEHALATIRSLKASLNNLINLLKPLINDANIALQRLPRPTCSENCKKKHTGRSQCYREAIETFDKVVEAGGPACFVQMKQAKPRSLPTSCSQLKAPSKSDACPSSRDHDHLHITSSHRTLLENLESQLTNLRKLCSQLNSGYRTYRNVPLRIDRKKQRNQDHALVETLSYWGDINRVQLDYEWVWGGAACRTVDSWEDFWTACKDVAVMESIGIGEFNMRIFIKNNLVDALEGTVKKKKRSWSIQSKKPPTSTLYADRRQLLPALPQPGLMVEGEWDEECEQCFKDCEENRLACERKAGKSPEIFKPSATPDSPVVGNAENIEEQLLYGIPQGLEEMFARILKMMKAESLTDKNTGRFTTKAKGKWRCEEEVLPEEELELYNRRFEPPAKKLCKWCRERKRAAEAVQYGI